MSAFMRRAPEAPTTPLLRICVLVLLTIFTRPARAVLIEFDNCLPNNFINSSPKLLQWEPLLFDARFDINNASYPLNVTIFGNVTGQQVEGPYPSPNSSRWSDPEDRFGKITNTDDAGQNLATLFAKFDYLTYNAYTRDPTAFCNASNLVNTSCPIAPIFNANASDPRQLHALTIAQEFYSPFAFSTLTATVTANYGTGQPNFACISANITPYIGRRIGGLLTWLPAAILIVKAIATLAAAVYSPWGSSDIFRWSSNYGRDEDLLRLVTPGFGDCLQYIQFILLTGSLTVQYPGFYQPAVARTSWSCLLFNESFVSHGPGTQNPIDGIYATTGPYGMQRMSQLIGMSHIDDIWACMAIWLAVIAGIVVLLCQLGFLARWLYRKITKISEEDLRKKNLPFTSGNLIRLLFNFFILPIVALSFFQLITAPESPIAVVVMSAILLVAMILSAIWILRFIFGTKPREFLFDDMPTVLMYGPLYNTYSDSAAPFALIPVFITFMRGVAIGAVQPSGIAQIVILAVCEVILILTLNGLRPFQNQTSMNLYHTLFSSVRLITVLLQIAFLPSLGVTEAPKGWIGYVILILHGCVLVFGFFLNAAQTLLEVIARALGFGGNSRGNIWSSRMLKKRQNRPLTTDGQSLMSSAAMVRHTDEFDAPRSRSLSASSQQLLSQATRTPSTHRLSGWENSSNGEAGANHISGDTESTSHHGRTPSKKSTDITGATENFYRPPRPRRGTMDLLTPGAKSRQSVANPEVPYSDSLGAGRNPGDSYDGQRYSKRDTLAAAYLRDRTDSDAEINRPDYAVREVDQYYRGPPLSDAGPTRKLKTGPADPQSPASNAQSWFQRMMFGLQGKNKQKESNKGFEIVRSTRMPVEDPEAGNVQEGFEMVNSPPMNPEPYTDSPPEQYDEPHSVAGAEREVGPPARPLSAGHNRETFNFEFSGPQESSGQGQSHRRDVSLTTLNTLSTTHPALRPSMDTDAPSHPGLRAEVPSRNSTPSGYGRVRTESASRSTEAVPDLPTLSPIQSIGALDSPSLYSRPRGNSDEYPEQSDWLRAVDNLSWTNYSRNSGQFQSSTNRHSRPPPVVPGRSPMRPSSSTSTSTPPRTATEPPRAYVGTHEEPNLDDLERLTSFAVSHKRAADSITRNSFGAGQVASSAEVYEDDQQQQQPNRI